MHTIKASLLLWIGKYSEFCLYLEQIEIDEVIPSPVCSGWDSF